MSSAPKIKKASNCVKYKGGCFEGATTGPAEFPAAFWSRPRWCRWHVAQVCRWKNSPSVFWEVVRFSIWGYFHSQHEHKYFRALNYVSMEVLGIISIKNRTLETRRVWFQMNNLRIRLLMVSKKKNSNQFQRSCQPPEKLPVDLGFSQHQMTWLKRRTSEGLKVEKSTLNIPKLTPSRVPLPLVKHSSFCPKNVGYSPP